MKITILKDSIPYSTDITIKDKTYQFEFIFNSYDRRVYINLYDKCCKIILIHNCNEICYNI